MFKSLFSLILLTTVFFANQCHAESLPISIMTFNIENGGTQVDFNQIPLAIKKAGADIVGIQEAWGNTARLAKALGWKYYDNAHHIVSRYPLLQARASNALYVFVEVTPGKVIALANIHLPDDAYGPDLIKQGASRRTVEKSEQNIRLAFVLPYIHQLTTLAKQGIPVFLTGDFNSPSHFDWQHRTVKVNWPVTRTLAANNLVDSYHLIHHATNNDNMTWPSGRPLIPHAIDGYNPSSIDLPDRIDFIFTNQATRVLNSRIIGEKNLKPWPSDHRAVVSSFLVNPIKITVPTIPIKPQEDKHKPSIYVSKLNIHPGEVFLISWQHAPGNKLDYIRITPHGSKKLAWGEAVRLYTHAKTNGHVKYNAKNVKGNWLAWHKGEEGHWPLTPGWYDIALMLDDGTESVLASTMLEVKKGRTNGLHT